MRTAIYYPHSEVQSKNLIKTALLTWDHLEYIVPFGWYRPTYADREVAKAIEIIGRPRTPSQSEKRKVHTLLENLIASGVPDTFYYDARSERGADYEIWPQKLAPDTWDMLCEHGLVGHLLANRDYPARQAAGLTIMSMIADVMAGETRTRITDRGLAYATLANIPLSTTKRFGDVPDVVPLTFKSLALEHIDLKTLIAFREKEEKSGGHNYRALRHNYLDSVEAHLSKIADCPVGSNDRDELDRVFAEKMEDDLRDLKDELGIARQEALLSRDTLTFVLVGGAALLAAAVAASGAAIAIPPTLAVTAGAPITIGGVLGVASKYAAKRREILRKHPMAYLYQIGGQ